MKQLVIVTTFCILLFSSCKKEKTIWNSDWVAPLVNDTLTLDKYVENGSIISNSGYYELNFTRNLLDLNLSEVVQIPDTSFSKTFGIAFSNFVLNPGTSFVNSVEEHDLNLQGIELKKIRLSNGIVQIKLENPVNTPVFFKMQLVGVTKNGIPFDNTFKAPAGTQPNPGIVEGTVDISGYDLDLTGTSGGKFNVLQSLFTVTTDPNGITTSMTNTDITKITATLKDLKVDYARGYFGQQILSDTLETTIDFLTKVKSGLVDFGATDLKFTVTNGLKIPAKATISLIQNRNDITGKNVQLTTSQSGFNFGESFTIDPATGSWSTLLESKKEIDFNSSNSSIENYLENLGANQKIGYSIQLNPWGNTSGGWNELFPTSKLKVDVIAKMPLTIGLDGLTLKNTFDFEIKQDKEKLHIVSGGLTLLATNGFPISGALTLELLDANGIVLFTVDGTESIASSITGSTFSKGIQTANSIVHFYFTKEMVAKISQIKKLNVISKFSTPNASSTLNEPIKIPEGAFIGVKIKSDFKIENRY